MIKADAIVFVKGRLSLRDDEPKIIANEFILPDEIKTKYTKAIFIRLQTPGLDQLLLEELKNRLLKHHGKIPVFLNFLEPDGRLTRLSLGNKFAVKADDNFLFDVEDLFGNGTVSFHVGN